MNPEYADGALSIHAGNIAAHARYSGVGRGALYAATSKEGVLAELAHYGRSADSVAFVSRSVELDNVLDLTSPTVRSLSGCQSGGSDRQWVRVDAGHWRLRSDPLQRSVGSIVAREEAVGPTAESRDIYMLVRAGSDDDVRKTLDAAGWNVDTNADGQVTATLDNSVVLVTEYSKYQRLADAGVSAPEFSPKFDQRDELYVLTVMALE